MTFYSGEPEQCLRFGDIVTGFICATPTLNKPPYITSGQLDNSCQIEVTSNAYYAIATPCCSIDESVISLCPLQPIKASFLKNEYFSDDLTRINSPIPPDKGISKNDWEKLSDEVRAARISLGPTMPLLEIFIYPSHEQLKLYELKVREQPRSINDYMIDFRNIFKVKCNSIKRDSTTLSHLKILQLDLTARAELRDKMSIYFGRVPEEDKLQTV